MCQDVEANARRHPTVVTQDPYHLLLVELWHRCGGDLLIKLLPHGRHVAGGTRAYRTCVVVMSSHLVQAFQMDRVPAVQYTDVHRRVKQILEADRAVVMHCSFYTVMRILQDIAVATPAFFAVKVITATSSADAASITVILVLGDIIVKEVAFFAEVFSHACPTIRAVLLHILFLAAERADNLGDFVARDLVPFAEVDLDRILCLVVAMPAAEDLAAAGRPYPAPPRVMLAAVLLLLLLCPKIHLPLCEGSEERRRRQWGAAGRKREGMEGVGVQERVAAGGNE